MSSWNFFERGIVVRYCSSRHDIYNASSFLDLNYIFEGYYSPFDGASKFFLCDNSPFYGAVNCPGEMFLHPTMA